MWAVIFTGLPAAGKSTIRAKLATALQEWIASTARDMKSLGEAINEHEFAALNYCRNWRMVQASSDDVIDMVAALQGSTYSAVFDAYKSEADLAFWHRLRLGVACRTPVILIDRTFVSEKARKDVVQTVQNESAKAGVNYKFMCIEVITPPAQEWNARLAARPGKIIPTEVLMDMAKRQTSPRADAFKYDSFVSVDGSGVADDAVYLASRTIMNSVAEFR